MMLRQFLWFLPSLSFALTLDNQSPSPKLNDYPTQSQPSGKFYKNVQLGILDKVTGRVLKKTVTLDQCIQFGTITIRAKRCWHSFSPTHPETKAFLVINDISSPGIDKNIFRGWMFASTPSISTLEHPVYDVWVVGLDPKTSVDVNQKNENNPSLESPKLEKIDQVEDNDKLEKILKSIKS